MKRILSGLLLLLTLGWAGYQALPRPDLNGEPDWSRAYLASDGRLLRLGLADDDRYRLPVSLERIAPVMREATLLYEDRDFYRHGGIDLPALVRAGWQTYLIGERRYGASTITMQLVRLRYGYPHTLWGKLQQMARAVQVERHYSKAAILEAYLNHAPYGGNIEGIEAAARVYFDKPAARLSLPEALALAVVPQSPTRRNPASESGRAEMLAARSRLFTLWLEEHPEDQARQTQFELPLAVRGTSSLPFEAPHFVNSVATQTDTHGTIATTLDLALQKELEQLAQNYIAQRKPDGIHNLAALLLNTDTMAIEAQVGSADFFNDTIQGQVDGTRAPRSPGSALKPFIYALALDHGLIHPLTLLKDAPKRHGAYTPENFDALFMGPLSAREALITSRNVPAVNLLAQLPEPGFYGLLRQADIAGLKEETYYGLALALGGMELTMEEITGLYAMLANGGEWKPLHRLTNHRHDEGKHLLSAEAAYLTLDMLRANPPPQDEPLPGMVKRSHPVAWKTGTSYAFRDAWAVGVSGHYILAVWVGNFDGSGNPAFVGRSAAGPILFDMLRRVEQLRGPFQTNNDISRLNLRKVAVCTDSGDLPNRDCPRTSETWFIAGVSPIKVSDIHRAIPIDTATNTRACQHTPPRTRLEVYEFWPSDLLHIFRESGIARKTPPPFGETCDLQSTSNQGSVPSIQEPSPLITYVLRGNDEQGIPFSATTDADAQQLYWFVDNRLIGTTKRDERLFWKGQPGEYRVSVVDDQGRGNDTKLRIELAD